jgi:hypothetical protein
LGLLHDGARRTAMGVAALRLAEARFSTEQQIDAMVGHYRALIDGER